MYTKALNAIRSEMAQNARVKLDSALTEDDQELPENDLSTQTSVFMSGQ